MRRNVVIAFAAIVMGFFAILLQPRISSNETKYVALNALSDLLAHNFSGTMTTFLILIVISWCVTRTPPHPEKNSRLMRDVFALAIPNRIVAAAVPLVLAIGILGAIWWHFSEEISNVRKALIQLANIVAPFLH